MQPLKRRTFFGVLVAAFSGARARTVGVDLVTQPDVCAVTFTAVDPIVVDGGSFIDSYGLKHLARQLQEEGRFWTHVGQNKS